MKKFINVKTLAFIVVFALLFAMVSACASPEAPAPEAPAPEAPAPEAPAADDVPDPDREIVIGMTVTVVHPVWDHSFNGALDTAAGRNVRIITDAPQQGLVEEQVAIIENFIAQQVDAIALAPSDPEALNPVIQQAMDAGIPVITFGVDAPTSARLSFSGTDHAGGSRAGADLLAELIGGSGDIVITTGLLTSLDQQQRVEYFVEQIERYHPDINILDIQSGGGSCPIRHLTVMENLLTAFPNVDGVYGTSAPDGGAIAASFAMFNKDIPAVTWDDMPEILQGIRDGHITKSLVQQPYDWGVWVVEVFIDMLRHGIYPPEYVPTDFFVLSLENIDELYPE